MLESKIVGELNGQYVKLPKLKGEFVWLQHANEDELFMVVKGQLTITLKGQLRILKRYRPIKITKSWSAIIPNSLHLPGSGYGQ